MPSPQLPNYLRSNRRRMALSQGEVAFLIGKKRSAEISRYELFKHVPSLETALAYEAIYKMPVSEIFAGLYAKAERKVAERAKNLVPNPCNKSKERDISKRKLLKSLAASDK